VRTLLVLPAVTVPLALVAVWVAARRLGDAARGLTAEVEAVAEAGVELAALRDDLDRLGSAALRARRARTSAPRQ
jgi:hypothetical protein